MNETSEKPQICGQNKTQNPKIPFSKVAAAYGQHFSSAFFAFSAFRITDVLHDAFSCGITFFTTIAYFFRMARILWEFPLTFFQCDVIFQLDI